MVIIPAYTIWLLYFPTGLRNCCSCQRSRRLSAFPAALLFPGHSRHPGSLGGQTGPLPRSRCRPWITEFAHFFYTRRLFWFIKAPHATFDWSRPILCQAKGTIRFWMYNVRVQIGALNSNTITFLHISTFYVCLKETKTKCDTRIKSKRIRFVLLV